MSAFAIPDDLFRGSLMEADQLNILENTLTDLTVRAAALRRYL